jgi:hypothetical protein
MKSIRGEVEEHTRKRGGAEAKNKMRCNQKQLIWDQQQTNKPTTTTPHPTFRTIITPWASATHAPKVGLLPLTPAPLTSFTGLRSSLSPVPVGRKKRALWSSTFITLLGAAAGALSRDVPAPPDGSNVNELLNYQHAIAYTRTYPFEQSHLQTQTHTYNTRTHVFA